MRNLLLLLMTAAAIAACNPAKRVMNNKADYDRLCDACLKEHPCVNDTVMLKAGTDSVVQYTDYVPDLPAPEAHQEPDDPGVVSGCDTVWMTRTKTVTKKDTVMKVVKDTRAEMVLQKELQGKQAALDQMTIDANKYKAQANARAGIITVMGLCGLLLIVLAFMGGKFINRIKNEKAALRENMH